MAEDYVEMLEDVTELTKIYGTQALLLYSENLRKYELSERRKKETWHTGNAKLARKGTKGSRICYQKITKRTATITSSFQKRSMSTLSMVSDGRTDSELLRTAAFTGTLLSSGVILQPGLDPGG